MKTLVNVDEGPLIQGPEICPLMEIMSWVRKSRGSFDPKTNHSEERITLNEKSYQFKSFNGYLGDQLKSNTIRKMVKEPIMKFGDVGEKKEPWKVQDMGQLLNAI